MKQIGILLMNKVVGTWHIIVEPDYEAKDNPPFPPKIKVFIGIPDTKYAIFETTHYSTDYLEGKSFGFYARHNFDKDILNEIRGLIHDLNEKYYLNINEDNIFESIKNYYNSYFRGYNTDVRIKENIILSKEYIQGGMKEHGR